MLRKISVVFIGYSFAQFILFVTTPLFSRIYDKQAFGILGTIIAVSSITLPWGSLRYEYAMPLVKNIGLKYILLKICKRIVVFTTLMSVLICSILQLFFHIHKLSIPEVVLLAFVIFFQNNLQITNLYAISNNLVTKITVGKILQNVTIVILQIVMCFFLLNNGFGLVLSLTFSQFLNLLYISNIVKNKSYNKKIRKKDIKILLFKFKRMPLCLSWGDTINSLASSLPMLFFSSFYSISSAGVYFFAYSIFSAPIALLGTAVSQVVLKDFADRVIYGKSILMLFLKVTLGLFTCSIIYYLLTILVAKYSLLIFGNKWSELGKIIIFISAPIAVMLVASPLSTLLNTLNKNKYLLCWQAIYFFIVFLCLMIARYKSLEFILTIKILSIGMLLMYILYWCVIFVSVLKYENK